MNGRKIAIAGSAVSLALGLAACGSGGGGSSARGESPGGLGVGANTVDIYSSLPLRGPASDTTRSMVKGIRLALREAGGKAGEFKVHYTSLDDSTAGAGTWDIGQTAQNARKVTQDSKAVYYIGDLNSRASQISIPILNQGGVPQVSPASTYVGLTTGEPGSAKGEPQKYYPSGRPNFLRIVPRDTIQAAALLTLMKQDGCESVALANDKDTYGAGLAELLMLKAKSAGVKLLGNESIDKMASDYRSLGRGFKSQGADCFVFAGAATNGALALYREVARALPNARLYGGDAECESGFTNSSKHGVPPWVAKRFQCTVAALGPDASPGGKRFLAAYQAKYAGKVPDPYAIYGYEAMQLGLQTIAKLGSKGSDKSAVLDALFKTKNRSSVLGTYSFDQNGDTSLKDYGVYKVGPDGDPVFEKAIKAQG